LNNIGRVYKYLNKLDEALKYYAKSLSIKEKMRGKNSIDCAPTLHNIGKVLLIQGNTNKAL
jgi:tetratricopeptide (TPR) repeat protein